MMKSQAIILVGAGAMGRETASWLLDANQKSSNCQYQIKGFLDDNPNQLAGYNKIAPLLGKIQDYQPKPNDLFVMTIATPQTREKVVTHLKSRGAQFISFIHPSVIIGQNVDIGEGAVICPNCILTCDITLEPFVVLNTCTTVGHDCYIGAFSTINSKTEITGHNQIGKRCFFGVGARVIPGRKIGDDAVIGAGSVVIRQVKSGTTVFGNPAKKLG